MPVFSKTSSKPETASAATGCLSAAVAKAKAKAGPRLPRGATVVTGIKLSVTVATKLGLSMPYMQGISEAANEIMKYTNAMKTNRKECKKLRAIAEELMGALLAATGGVRENELSIPVSLSLAELEWKLDTIAKAVDRMRHESFVRRLLSKDEHASQLVEHREDLQNALNKFKMTQSVCADLALARVEKKQDMILEKLRAFGQVGQDRVGLGGSASSRYLVQGSIYKRLQVFFLVQRPSQRGFLGQRQLKKQVLADRGC